MLLVFDVEIFVDVESFVVAEIEFVVVVNVVDVDLVLG